MSFIATVWEKWRQQLAVYSGRSMATRQNKNRYANSLTHQKKLPPSFLCVSFCTEVLQILNWDAVMVKHLPGLYLEVQRNAYLSPTSQIIPPLEYECVGEWEAFVKHYGVL